MRRGAQVIAGFLVWSAVLMISLRIAAPCNAMGSLWWTSPAPVSTSGAARVGADETLRSLHRQNVPPLPIKSYVAEHIEPFHWLLTWDDLCATDRRRARSRAPDALRMSALGPQFLPAAVPHSETPCIGSEYLAYFHQSLTYRWAPYVSPNNETTTRFAHWAIDTPYVSFSPLLKPPNYEFIAVPTFVCSKEDFAKHPVRVLIMTLSHPTQIGERQKLRSYLPVPRGVRRVFIVGNPVLRSDYLTRCDIDGSSCAVDKKLLAQLDTEHKTYGDIIWANYPDTYQNLVHKTGAGFQWAHKSCPEAHCVWKMDADVYANYNRLLDHCRKMARLTWFGMCQYNWPSRNGTRNIVTTDEWPSNSFPLYAAGPAYGFSKAALAAVLYVLAHVRFPPIEDVTTGVAATLAGVECTDIGRQASAASNTDTASDPCSSMLATSDSALGRRTAELWKSCPA